MTQLSPSAMMVIIARVFEIFATGTIRYRMIPGRDMMIMKMTNTVSLQTCGHMFQSHALYASNTEHTGCEGALSWYPS